MIVEISTGTDPEISIATTETNPTATGVSSHRGETEAELVTRLASAVQDCVVESRRHFGLAWPPCPHPSHRHPLDAPYGTPGVWICPVTHDLVAEIGELDRS